MKHRAPNGALRPVVAAAHGCGEVEVIKHRASNDALRRADLGILPPAFTERVIKHRATGGALRHARPRGVGCSVVHGHNDRAPNGALKPTNTSLHRAPPRRHLASSAKRLIKTVESHDQGCTSLES